MAASSFLFNAPGDIRFGEGASLELGKTVRDLGARAFVVTGRTPGRHPTVLRTLVEAGVEYELAAVPAEPGFGDVREALAAARRFTESPGAERGAGFGLVVVGLGGGSALDAGKAVAILLGNEGDPAGYAEGGKGARQFARAGVPFIAVPTTAGTGSEATKNAVFVNEAHGIKVSLRSPLMIARTAIVDPSLTWGLGRDVTAASGMDALAQVLEPFMARGASPFTDAYCLGALERVLPALRACVAASANGGEPDDDARKARSDMSFVSLCGGIALANAGLGAVHGIAGPLGGTYSIPHGAACALFLGPVVEANVRALRARDPNNPVLGKYALAARLLMGNEKAVPEDLGPLLSSLPREFGMAPLGSYGIAQGDIASLAGACAATNGMKSNPVHLDDREIAEAFARAFEAGKRP